MYHFVDLAVEITTKCGISDLLTSHAVLCCAVEKQTLIAKYGADSFDICRERTKGRDLSCFFLLLLLLPPFLSQQKTREVPVGLNVTWTHIRDAFYLCSEY